MRAVSHPYRLWLWLTLCLVVLGCQKSGTPTAPSSPGATGMPVTVSFGVGESIPAMFEVTVDPVAMQATSRPLTARTVAGFQASQFDLDITKFQTRAQFDVQSVEFTEIGDVEATFRHAHPWSGGHHEAGVGDESRRSRLHRTAAHPRRSCAGGYSVPHIFSPM